LSRSASAMARACSTSALAFSSVAFVMSSNLGLSALWRAFIPEGEPSSQRCLPSGRKVRLDDSPACTMTSHPPGTEARLVTSFAAGSEATVSQRNGPVDLPRAFFWALADAAQQTTNSATKERRRYIKESSRRDGAVARFYRSRKLDGTGLALW